MAEPLRRHRVDAFALTVGLLALAGAVLFLGWNADLFRVDGLVLLASVWVVVGVVGLSLTLQRLLTEGRAQETEY